MLCHHVLGHGYRPPALTAKMAATLQVLSGNRFMLGIGAGWRGDEYEAYGYDFPEPMPFVSPSSTKLVQICRLMWTEDEPSPSPARYYRDHRGLGAAPARNVVPPICIGANGEQVGLPLVGREADVWHWLRRHDKADWSRTERAIVAASRPTPQAATPQRSSPAPSTIERPAPRNRRGVRRTPRGRIARTARTRASRHFVMDFGHPLSPEPIHRFAEQVMAAL